MLITGLISGANSARAQSSKESFRDQFSSSLIEFDGKDAPLSQNSSQRYPLALSYVFDNLMSWVPSGEKNNKVAACQASVLVEQSEEFPQNLKPCMGAWETGVNLVFPNLVNMLAMKLQHKQHPFLNPLTLHLPGGIKLRGLLALKGDLKKRPLVIVRSGIFSGIDQFVAERAWYIMLFEQAPFNILVLDNLTSTRSIENNSQFSFGGYDEGVQNIWIARALQKNQEPLSKIIESIHFFGISLGGHGTLYASLLNKLNSGKSPLIKSFIALCPVVDLKPTMMTLVHERGLKSALIDMWGRRRLSVVEKKIHLENAPTFSFLFRTVEEVSKTYKGTLLKDPSIKIPSGLRGVTDFWTLNDFWPYYEDVREPVYIFTTQQDPAVPLRMNTSRLKTELSTPEKTKNILDYNFSHGVHCTLPIAYDWGSMSELFRSLILRHSPGFKMSEQTWAQELPHSQYELLSWQVLSVDIPEDIATLQFRLKKGKTVLDQRVHFAISRSDFVFHDRTSSEDMINLVKRWLVLNLQPKVEGKQLVLSWKVAK